MAVCAENVLERSTGDLLEPRDLWTSSLGRGVGRSGLLVRREVVLGVARVGGVAPREVRRLDLIAVGVCATRDSTLVRGLARLLVDVVRRIATLPVFADQVEIGR